MYLAFPLSQRRLRFLVPRPGLILAMFSHCTGRRCFVYRASVFDFFSSPRYRSKSTITADHKQTFVRRLVTPLPVLILQLLFAFFSRISPPSRLLLSNEKNPHQRLDTSPHQNSSHPNDF
ncbi:hypothetical protein VTL71DRAFT_11743 [Oculimacula yallundae]|uniref:Secreted protein n=1 Tax=Oculimacula yallundae TaxID=86028 RepID=A0ABR4CRB1_9HELO